ncbi:MAG: MBL fold metallo-hydrolase [Clostridiales bacterium]|nr:MBL fold metallo-hydrolase [Clostridiales bacterium]
MLDKELKNVTVNTQSSIRIAGEKIVYFDPLKLEGNPQDADVIYITHDHYDHFSPEDIQKAANSDTVIVFPKSMETELAKTAIPAERQYAVRPGDQVSVCGIQTEAIAAYNVVKPFHPKRSAWVGYIICMDGIRYYYSGDSDATKEAKAVDCDVAFIPIGGTYTTNARDAAEWVNAIKPAVVVPVHYGSIVGKLQDADVFKERVSDDIQVVIKITGE